MQILFISFESAFGIKLKQEDKDNIRHAIYPLSNKNHLTITEQDIQESLQELKPIGVLDHSETKKFLLHYLQENIKDML